MGQQFKNINLDLVLVLQGLAHAQVHAGFLKRFEALADELLRDILQSLRDGKNGLIFTGHSLGGGIASLAAVNLLARSVRICLLIRLPAHVLIIAAVQTSISG